MIELVFELHLDDKEQEGEAANLLEGYDMDDALEGLEVALLTDGVSAEIKYAGWKERTWNG